MSKNTNLSLNKLTAPLVENLIVNAESLRLDVSNLNDGVYILEIVTDKEINKVNVYCFR